MVIRRVQDSADLNLTKRTVNSILGDIEAIIGSNVSQAAKALNEVVKKLERQITAERESRNAADTSLQGQIDTKASDADLATERSERIAADSGLQGQINTKASNAAHRELEAKLNDLVERVERLENPEEPEED